MADIINQQSSFSIVPADGILFGITIGLIVACFNTAWPTYALAEVWLTMLGRAPIRLAHSWTNCIAMRSSVERAPICYSGTMSSSASSTRTARSS